MTSQATLIARSSGGSPGGSSVLLNKSMMKALFGQPAVTIGAFPRAKPLFRQATVTTIVAFPRISLWKVGMPMTCSASGNGGSGIPGFPEGIPEDFGDGYPLPPEDRFPLAPEATQALFNCATSLLLPTDSLVQETNWIIQEANGAPRVTVMIGSSTDLQYVQKSLEIFAGAGLPYEVIIISKFDLDGFMSFIMNLRARGVKLIFSRPDADSPLNELLGKVSPFVDYVFAVSEEYKEGFVVKIPALLPLKKPLPPGVVFPGIGPKDHEENVWRFADPELAAKSAKLMTDRYDFE